MNQEFKLTNGDGSKFVYYDFSSGVPTGRAGKLKSYTAPGGQVLTVSSYDSAGRPTEIQMVDSATSNTQSLQYAYSSTGQVNSMIRRQKTGAGAWSTVRTADFTYTSQYGSSGLQYFMNGATEKDAAGNTLAETYQRFSSGMLKYQFDASSTARLKAAFTGTALDSLSDAQIAPYAVGYLEYDSGNRATKLTTSATGCSACSGGQGTVVSVQAQNSSAGTGVNDWKTKITNWFDDGSVRTTYANKNGQQVLQVTQEPTTGKTWLSYTRYDSVGRVILQASPSAVSGYDDTLTDLVGYGSGSNATYLNDSVGQVVTTAYGSSTTATTSAAGDVSGYLKSTSIQKGESGTAVKQSETCLLYTSPSPRDS